MTTLFHSLLDAYLLDSAQRRNFSQLDTSWDLAPESIRRYQYPSILDSGRDKKSVAVVNVVSIPDEDHCSHARKRRQV